MQKTSVAHSSTRAMAADGSPPKGPTPPGALRVNTDAPTVEEDVLDARLLRVVAVTWNMNNRRFPEDVTPMLAPLFDGRTTPGDAESACDVFVVGVQEAPGKKEMEGFSDAVVHALGGFSKFAHLDAVTLDPGGWIQLHLFMRKKLVKYVSDFKVDAVSCGIGKVYGNKGAVGVSFSYAGASMCFLNAHLAAHLEKVKQRNADYHRIVKTMFAPKGRKSRALYDKENAQVARETADADGWGGADDLTSERIYPTAPSQPGTPIDPTRPTPATPKMFGGLFKKKGWSAADGFDLCVFMGDLNYRVEGNRTAVDKVMELGMWEVMHANDQLAVERNAGRAFAGGCEAELTFPPTYKLNRGSATEYDTSAKQRIPSWTDRIMWISSARGRLSCPHGADVYASVPGVRTSDHLPVLARIEVAIGE